MGRKPTISREKAAQAALDAIDEHGIDGLKLDDVAARLGVRAPSLYNHFEDRAELLRDVAKLIWSQAQAPVVPRADEDWQEALVRRVVAVRRAILEHPNAAPLLLQVLPRHIFTDRYEQWINAFAEHGVPVEFHAVLIEGVEALTHGSAMFAAAAVNLHTSAFPPVDPITHPRLAAALNSTKRSPEHLFEATVRAFLAGLLPGDNADQPARERGGALSSRG